jgi:uncharacterized protein (DUF1810 family)
MKTGHWMWFVFPQLDGLGRSPTARRYAIASLQHAREYSADPVLGARLRECCEVLLALPDAATAEQALGQIDAIKLRSCVTLFARAETDDRVFRDVLVRFYGGTEDEATVGLLEGRRG